LRFSHGKGVSDSGIDLQKTAEDLNTKVAKEAKSRPFIPLRPFAFFVLKIRIHGLAENKPAT